MAKQGNATWEDLERVAKNVLREIIMYPGDHNRLELDACVFVLTQDLENLKYVEGSDEKSSDS